MAHKMVETGITKKIFDDVSQDQLNAMSRDKFAIKAEAGGYTITCLSRDGKYTEIHIDKKLSEDTIRAFLRGVKPGERPYGSTQVMRGLYDKFNGYKGIDYEEAKMITRAFLAVSETKQAECDVAYQRTYFKKSLPTRIEKKAIEPVKKPVRKYEEVEEKPPSQSESKTRLPLPSRDLESLERQPPQKFKPATKENELTKEQKETLALARGISSELSIGYTNSARMKQQKIENLATGISGFSVSMLTERKQVLETAKTLIPESSATEKQKFNDAIKVLDKALLLKAPLETF